MLGALVIGYLLLMIGAVSLIYAAYHAWALFDNPYLIVEFSDKLQLSILRDQKPDASSQELFRLVSWPIIIFLLLLQGLIGTWAIEASARLLDTLRDKQELDS